MTGRLSSMWVIVRVWGGSWPAGAVRHVAKREEAWDGGGCSIYFDAWRHRLEAQDAALSRRRSRVRIPLALPVFAFSGQRSAVSFHARRCCIERLLAGLVGLRV